jgi:hypothetical protein
MSEKYTATIGGIVLVLAAMLFNTWIVSCLWGWYLTPVFQLAVPKLYLIFGIVLIVKHLSGYIPREDKDEKIVLAIVGAFVRGGGVLFIGWTVQAIWA